MLSDLPSVLVLRVCLHHTDEHCFEKSNVVLCSLEMPLVSDGRDYGVELQMISGGSGFLVKSSFPLRKVSPLVFLGLA